MSELPPPHYEYTPPDQQRRGGAAIWFVGLLGLIAIAGVAFFVIEQANAGQAAKHQIAQPTPTSTGKHAKNAKVPRGRAAAYQNPLYKLPKKPGYPCHAPTLDTHSTQSVSRFLTKISDCLDQSWARQFKAAKIPFSPPTRVYWTQPGNSPCGGYPQAGAAAFYCSSNRAMYIGLSDVVKNSADAPGKYYSIYASVLAHEYGHHVQEAAGILDYGHSAEDASGGENAKDAISRKIELQANCFDGVYLNSIGQTLPMTALQRRLVTYDAYYRGDRTGFPRDHGSRKHFRGWLVRGLQYGRPGMCNTWSAAPGRTS